MTMTQQERFLKILHEITGDTSYHLGEPQVPGCQKGVVPFGMTAVGIYYKNTYEVTLSWDHTAQAPPEDIFRQQVLFWWEHFKQPGGKK